MLLSNSFIPILKNNPSEAKIKSHQLMLRVGMIKQASAGIYSWLPLGFKVMKKIEDIVRQEQNGEHRHMIEHINFAKEMQVPHQVQVENGDIVKLYPGEKPEVYDKAPSGRLYLDGSVSVDPDSQSIKDRKNLSANGYLEVTIMV